MAVYQARSIEVDREQLPHLTRLATKLIGFFGRKSLSQWHREELADWIDETLTRIEAVDNDTVSALRDDFRHTVAEQLGVSAADLEARAKEYADRFETAFDELDDEEPGPGAAFDSDDPQEDLFGFDDIWEGARAGEASFDEGTTYGREELEDAADRAQRLMDGSWARGLFRRTVQALHPDRESDPERRKVKEDLMQQLLAARERDDIMTLLQLYSEHVAEDDLVLAEQEMTTACELMESRLEQLRLEHAACIYDSPQRLLVHELLYSPSQKKREKNIQAWARQLKVEAQQNQRLVEELRNLTVLKDVLAQRREQRVFDHLDARADGLWL